MAVYTEITPADIGRWLPRYFPGARLTGLTPVSAGIENTNYFVDLVLEGGPRRVVLTIFETLPARALPFYARLTEKLAQHGLPVPAPIADGTGNWVCRIAGKPALWLPCLPGQHVQTPSRAQCQALGAFMRAMHAQTAEVPGEPHPRDVDWMRRIQSGLGAMPDDARTELADAIDWATGRMAQLDQLPGGIVHGDLFVDNALFEGDRLTGVIDFYHAAHAPLLFDVAVALNDWCFQGGDYNDALCRAMLGGYRELDSEECRLLPDMMALAALRFWLSRLSSLYQGGYQHQARAGETLKNPDEMAARFRAAQQMDQGRMAQWFSSAPH